MARVRGRGIRGHHAAVVFAVLVGAGALYVALGGPLPFLAPGGPALDSVPAEADAVAYANAWTFTEGSSQGVADGLLSITDESVPGYAGPATLEEAVETLEAAGLEPRGLRSITAFGAYGPDGGPSDYGGVVLKTTWSEETLLSALGGSTDAYEERTHNGKTVYVAENESADFRAIAVLGPNRYVLGNVSAVEDSVDATVEDDESMDEDLRSGFRSLSRGPIRFSATAPERFPGSEIAPRSVTDTVADIDTVGGVYYPDDGDVTVELSIRATDAATAKRIEPTIDEGVGFARDRAPPDSRDIVDDATVERSGRTLTLTLSGRTDAYVAAYRSVLRSPAVRALLGERVGTPALSLVPDDAGVIGYADASAISDPAVQSLATSVASGSNVSESVTGTLEGVPLQSAADLATVRSTTVFTRNDSATPDTDAAALVQADWETAGVERALNESDSGVRRQQVDGRTVLATGQENVTWIAVLDNHTVVGDPQAVRSVLTVVDGDAPAVSGPMVDRFEDLSDRPLRLVARTPAVGGGLGSLLETIGGPEYTGLTYGNSREGGVVTGRFYFDGELAAAAGNATTAGALGLLIAGVEDEQVRSVLESTTVRQSGEVVTVQAVAPPGRIAALVELLVSGESPLGEGSENGAREEPSEVVP